MMKMMNIFKLPVISNIIIFKMKSFYRGVSFTKRGTLINKKKKTMTFAEIKSKLELIEFRYI